MRYRGIFKGDNNIPSSLDRTLLVSNLSKRGYHIRIIAAWSADDGCPLSSDNAIEYGDLTVKTDRGEWTLEPIK